MNRESQIMKKLSCSTAVTILIAVGSLAPMTIVQAQPPTIVVAPPNTGSNGSQSDAPSQPAQPAGAPQAQEEGPISITPSAPPPPATGPISAGPSAASSRAGAGAPPANAGPGIGGESGTTIVGDQEAPIGLYITPWKNEFAENGLDRPARFVDVDTAPIDPDVFKRRVEYYDVITAYRNAHLSSGK